MNKNVIGIAIAVVAIIGIAAVAMTNKSDSNNSSSAQNPPSSDMAGMDMNKDKEKSQASGEQDLTGQPEISMDIKEFEYAKNNIKVSKGTKVTWTNQDEAKHNVVSNEPGGPKSELLGQGESYSFTFATAGTFNYICEPHPYMKGAVDVVE